MKLAFAGAGTISVVHAMAAAAVEAEIVAVASRTNERATERAAQVGAQVVAFEDLPAGADAVVELVLSSDHVGDLLFDVVQDVGQLELRQAIGADQHEVPGGGAASLGILEAGRLEDSEYTVCVSYKCRVFAVVFEIT